MQSNGEPCARPEKQDKTFIDEKRKLGELL